MMNIQMFMRKSTSRGLLSALVMGSLLFSLHACAQQEENLEQVMSRIPTAPPGLPLPTLSDEPLIFDTGEGMPIEVAVVAKGLSHPWGFASLPDNTLLVSERNAGRLRVIRNGVLDPQPVPGIPEVRSGGFTGLLDIVLHPDFDSNQLIYLTYNKPLGEDEAAMAVLRGKWNGRELVNAEDIFVAPAGVSGASRLLFDHDGMLYMSLYGGSEDAQDLGQLRGKVIRLTEDGEVPADNPFVGTEGARPEIYTYGHRTIQGMVLHPLTGQIWSMEMGPNGGDEINILKPGANYGWPYVSLGRDYAGSWQASFHKDGMEDPVVFWMPSISVSGMTFYTGDKLPAWKGDLLVGGLRMGEIPGTGQLQRIRLNALDQEIRRESLLVPMRFRIRGAYQGRDGYLYALTDEDNGAVLRIGAAQ